MLVSIFEIKKKVPKVHDLRSGTRPMLHSYRATAVLCTATPNPQSRIFILSPPPPLYLSACAAQLSFALLQVDWIDCCRPDGHNACSRRGGRCRGENMVVYICTCRTFDEASTQQSPGKDMSVPALFEYFERPRRLHVVYKAVADDR